MCITYIYYYSIIFTYLLIVYIIGHYIKLVAEELYYIIIINYNNKILYNIICFQ